MAKTYLLKDGATGVVVGTQTVDDTLAPSTSGGVIAILQAPPQNYITGSLTGTGSSDAGVFKQQFNVSIWGTFTATVRLEKSYDGGANWVPASRGAAASISWTGPISTVWSEVENATDILYRLTCTAYTSGTINYRLSPTRAADAADLDLNFLLGSIDSRITVARASTAYYFDSTGTLASAANNTGRIDYTPGTLVPRGMLFEEARTNSIRNPRAEGAVVSGSLPTNWSVLNAIGLTTTVTAVGTENGIPYVEVRVNGTSTGPTYRFGFEAALNIAVSNGQSWSISSYVRLTAGNFTNVNTLSMGWINTDGSNVTTTTNEDFTLGLPSGAALATQRKSSTKTISDASAAFARPCVAFGLTNGAAIDFTVRIGGPQFELGTYGPTSLILPPAASPAATTRAVESATMPLGSWYDARYDTFILEANLPLVYSAVQSLLHIDGGSLAERIVLRSAATQVPNVLVATSNVTSLILSNGNLTGSVSAGATFKMGISLSSDGQGSGRFNGGAATSGSGAISPSMTTLRFGTGGVTASQTPNGYIRRLRYWARRLSDTELQGLTT